MTWLSELFGIFQQLDYAFEQAPGASTVDAAMIKTQRELGFGPGNKLVFLLIPGRDFFPNSKPKQQCLIGQRNRCAPFHSKSSEVRNGRETARLHVRRNSPLSRKFHELLVFCRKVGKRGFVCAAN